MKTEKSCLALTALFLSVAVSVPATVDEREADYRNGRERVTEMNITSGSSGSRRQTQTRRNAPGTRLGETVSVEAFYGLDRSDNETDIGGVTFRYTVRGEDSGPSRAIVPEGFVSVRGGKGKEDRVDARLLLWSMCVGGGLRSEFNQVVSAFFRAEIGFGIAWAEADFRGESDSDTDVGLAYSAGVGLQFDITKHQSVTCSVDCFGMTASPSPSLYVEGCRADVDDPMYVLFSVGYKWTY